MQNKIWKKTLSVVLTCGMLFPMSSFIQEPMVVDAKTNVELSKTTLRMMTGETTRLQVFGGTAEHYESTDETVATVSKNGTITAVGEGTTAIVVYVNGNKFYCRVTVKDSVDSVSINKEMLNLRAGQRELLLPIATPVSANQNFTFTSSNTDVVTVSASGYVFARKNGTAVVTATSVADPSKKVTCTVQVGGAGMEDTIDSESVMILGKPSVWKVGKEYDLQGMVFPVYASNREVTWESSNPSVASIDQDGKLMFSQTGTVTITCTAKDGKSYASMTISATGAASNPDDTIYVSSIIIDGNASGMKVGEIRKLTANVYPENATDRSVRWSSSNPSVVKVSQDGTLEAITEGTAEIICESNDGMCKSRISASVISESTQIFVTDIIVPELKGSFEVGDKKKLTTEIYPSNATNKEVVFSSSNDEIATVENGYLIVKDSGKVFITVTAQDGSHTKTVYELNIPEQSEEIPVEEIDIEGLISDRAVGDQFQLRAVISPSNATNKNVVWSSSNEDVAVIDQDGNVTLTGLGEVEITCQSLSSSKAKTILRFNVTKEDHDVHVTSISLSGIPQYTYVGDSYQIQATVLPENATNKEVIWSSSDSKIMSVDQNGRVVALSTGKVTIQATSADRSEVYTTATITVNRNSSETVYADKVEITPIDPDEIPEIGGTLQLEAKISPLNVTDKRILWESNNDQVATVDSNGLLTIHGPGKVRISAYSGDRRAGAYVDITIQEEHPDEILVEEILLSGVPTTAPSVGDEFTVSHTIVPSNATNPNVTWSSSNPNVATVDQNGHVRVIGQGTTTILCQADGSDANRSFTFTTASASSEITDIILSGFPTKFDSSVIGDTFQLSAQVLPETESQNVIWSSNNPDVATVTEDGLLKIVGFGEVQITCTSADGSFEKYQPLYIRNTVQSMTINEPTQVFYEGETYQFGISFNPEDATNTAGTWSVDQEDLASIDETGLLTAKKAGTVTIRYTLDDGRGYAECTLTIQKQDVVTENENPVTLINIEGLDGLKTLEVGESYELSASVSPAWADSKEVTWISEDPEVATITENGVLTIHKEGTVRITCRANTYVEMEGTTYPSAETNIIKLAVNSSSGGSVEIPEEDQKVERIALDSIGTVTIGQRYKIRATVYPSTADNQNLEWMSTNPDVISVDSDGYISVHDVGAAVIFCSATDGSGVSIRRAFRVENKVQSVSLITPPVIQEEVPIDLSDYLSVNYLYADKSHGDFQYSFEVMGPNEIETTAASITEDGVLTIHDKTETFLIQVSCDNNTQYRVDDNVEVVYSFNGLKPTFTLQSQTTYNPSAPSV